MAERKEEQQVYNPWRELTKEEWTELRVQKETLGQVADRATQGWREGVPQDVVDYLDKTPAVR